MIYKIAQHRGLIMIKKGNQRITITLNNDELKVLDLINSNINKKTYTQAIKMLIKLFLIQHIIIEKKKS